MAFPCGGHSCRIGSVVPAIIGADKRRCATWRGNNCPECCRMSALHPLAEKIPTHPINVRKVDRSRPLLPLHEAPHGSSFPTSARTEIARDRSAHRQVNVLPLVTFLGRARKVTRLPAGTGEVQDCAFVLVLAQRQNRRVASRQTPYFLSRRQQKEGKKWLSLPGAFLSPRFCSTADGQCR
jgi:hypothetical protein